MKRLFKEEKLKNLRKDLHLKYVDIEMGTGIKPYTFQNKEKYGNVRISEFLMICNGLKLPACYFIADKNEYNSYFSGNWQDISFDRDSFKSDVACSQRNIQMVCLSLGITYNVFQNRFNKKQEGLLITEVCDICNRLGLELATYLHDPNVPLVPDSTNTSEKPSNITYISNNTDDSIEQPLLNKNTTEEKGLKEKDSICIKPHITKKQSSNNMREEELQRYMTYIETEVQHLQSLVNGMKTIISLKETNKEDTGRQDDDIMAAEDETPIYGK